MLSALSTTRGTSSKLGYAKAPKHTDLKHTCIKNNSDVNKPLAVLFAFKENP